MKRTLLTSVTVCLSYLCFGQATLPVLWDFSTTTLPIGFDSVGNFGFYPASGNPAPAGKFSATGDMLIISFSQPPGNITYDIVGNAFSGGTFLVEESTDSITWITLNTYTAPPSVYTPMTDIPSVLSRYIRFNYLNKVSGNIGLDNVNIDLASATISCYASPDGTDGSGWSYKDFIIPSGYKVDSVFMDASRSGFPVSDYDFVFQSCAGTTTYNSGIATYPFDYSTENSSLYGIWIDLTAFNITSVGMVRACLPTNAGATWNNLCLAVSPTITTNIEQTTELNVLTVYPNPATDYIYLNNVKSVAKAEMLNVLGQQVKSLQIINPMIDLSDLPKGVYFLKVVEQESSARVVKFIKQ